VHKHRNPLSSAAGIASASGAPGVTCADGPRPSRILGVPPKSLGFVHRFLHTLPPQQRKIDVQNLKQPINPFYLLCVLVGVAFTVTACGQLVLMLRANRGASSADDAGNVHPLLNLLDEHGMTILAVEVALLAVVSIAAIVLDHYRGKRERKP
jgi:hypothetical protein